MKKFLFTILLLSAIWSCRTKKVDLTKEKEITKTEIRKRLDSVFNVVNQTITQNQNFKQNQILDFSLETITDTLGNVQDLQFTHEKNGKIIEQITVKGGKLTIAKKDTTAVQATQTEAVQTSTGEIKSDSKKKTETFQKTKVKAKEINEKTPTFGIIILVIVAVGIYVLGRILKKKLLK